MRKKKSKTVSRRAAGSRRSTGVKVAKAKMKATRAARKAPPPTAKAGNGAAAAPAESKKYILGSSKIFTPEVINDIHIKAELGRYRMRGFSLFKKFRTGMI